MKNIIYIVLIVTFTACNTKQLPVSIVIGETKNMFVTEFDYTFKGVWVGYNQVNERTHSFDINGDGSEDFSLISFVDSVYQPATNSDGKIYGVRLVLEDNYSVKTQIIEEGLGIQSMERDTLFPGQSWSDTYLLSTFNCQGSEEELSYNQESQLSFIKRLNTNDNIAKNDNLWINYGSNGQLIYQTNYNSYYNYEYNNYEFNCINPDKNSPFFIPILLSNSDVLGWIELEILEDNTVHLIRTATQE